jgi:dihydroorotase
MRTSDRFELPAADDLHVHVRQGDMLQAVAPLVYAGGAGRCLAMPNTVPPVCTAAQAVTYRQALATAEPRVQWLTALYLTPQLTPDEVQRAADAGVVAVKCYPKGVTTNSASGVEDLRAYGPVFKTLQERGLVLAIHGEVPSSAGPDVCVLNAEERFLPELRHLHEAFPRLKMILEHVSTAAAVAAVRALGPTVAATVTPHHLLLTVDDWAGCPHHYTKPVAKLPADRDALCAVVREGHPRFFLGSDSAPHPRAHKECAHPHPGTFSSPLLMPLLADYFESQGCLDRLPDFTSRFGREFYGLPAGSGARITLERHTWTVPAAYGDIVPLQAGRKIGWQLAGR